MTERTQEGELGDAIREAIEGIERAPYEPQLVPGIAEEALTYQEAVGDQLSRATQRNNHIARLQAAIEKIDERRQGLPAAEQTTLKGLADTLQAAIDEWEEVEFPSLSN